MRSWWKEELHSRPSRSVAGTALAVSLALLLPLFVLHLRQRSTAKQHEHSRGLQDGLGIVEVAYGSLSRAVFDWGRWDNLYGFVSGTNPRFPITDIQTAALFDGGMVMLVFNEAGKPLVTHALRGHQPREMAALVRCARGVLSDLRTLASSVRLLCRDPGGQQYIGVVTSISNSDSTAPRRGTLVFLDPLIRNDYNEGIRRSLQSFQANVIWLPPGQGRDPILAPPEAIRPLIHGDGGALLAFRPLPLLPILARVLLEDLLLALALVLGLLGFRSILLLERRRQRLSSRLRERLADGRIRRVCRELDQLHAQMGLDSRAASQGRQALGRLLRQRQLHGQPPLPPGPAQDDLATRSGKPGVAAGFAMAERKVLGGAAAPSVTRLGDVDDRLERLASQFQEFLDSAQTLALIDPLTQLPNRRFFLDQLALVASTNCERGTRYAVLFVDVDRFKAINDTFGHSFGDNVLKIVAQRLRQLLRPNDFLCRYGGDELAILMDLSEISPPSEEVQRATAHALASRITASLANLVRVDGIPIEVSLSIGIALIDPRVTSTPQAMQQSDIAMYRAKRHKHSRIAIFDVADQCSELETYQLYLDLMAAVRKQQVQVEFQPIVDGNNNILAVEALARWHHPSRGMIPPEEFLGLAQKHRQLGVLWEAILRCSLSDFAALRQGIPGLCLAVNLHPTQLSDQHLLQLLDEQLASHDIEPQALTIEITERAVLEATLVMRNNLSELRQRGVRISLDDFGTGYSSLTLLSELRPDEIKIDRSFVDVMDKDPYIQGIVVLIVSLARDLGISLVAEGVERSETLKILAQLGVEKFQGYLFSRPRPWQEIEPVIHPLPASPQAPA
jgi:diguanylate cyclase (GGDEF)-like protein